MSPISSNRLKPNILLHNFIYCSTPLPLQHITYIVITQHTQLHSSSTAIRLYPPPLPIFIQHLAHQPNIMLCYTHLYNSLLHIHHSPNFIFRFRNQPNHSSILLTFSNIKHAQSPLVLHALVSPNILLRHFYNESSYQIQSSMRFSARCKTPIRVQHHNTLRLTVTTNTSLNY